MKKNIRKFLENVKNPILLTLEIGNKKVSVSCNASDILILNDDFNVDILSLLCVKLIEEHIKNKEINYEFRKI